MTMVINLNIQKVIEENGEKKGDYYVMYGVERNYNAKGDMRVFDKMRYVNTFFSEKLPKICASASSATAGKAVPCPQGLTQPLNDGKAPPPLKPQHQGYSNRRLDTYFRATKERFSTLPWNFQNAVYAHPTKWRSKEHNAVKSLKITYGGKLARLQGRYANLRGLIRQVNRDTQIIGLLGHSLRAHVGSRAESRGRIIIGNQHIIEDDPITRQLTQPAKKVFLTNERIKRDFQDLGNKISPLAVIVLYHCYNGGRKKFLQDIADLVHRPVFAYTGFLGWFTVDYRIRVKGKVKKTIMKQEFNYHPNYYAKQDVTLFQPEGDWVAAIPN
jgi:hypothetical protein